MSNCTAAPGGKARFTRFLRELADYLDQAPASPVPCYSACLTLHTRCTSTRGRAEIDRIAMLLDAPVHDGAAYQGGYWAAREFTLTGYEVIALALSPLAASPAPDCYHACDALAAGLDT
jgi:hypothetical protein